MYKKATGAIPSVSRGTRFTSTDRFSTRVFWTSVHVKRVSSDKLQLFATAFSQQNDTVRIAFGLIGSSQPVTSLNS
jgi:hypothetical protein